MKHVLRPDAGSSIILRAHQRGRQEESPRPVHPAPTPWCGLWRLFNPGDWRGRGTVARGGLQAAVRDRLGVLAGPGSGICASALILVFSKAQVQASTLIIMI